VLLARNSSDFFRDLGKVLVLTEDNCNVIFICMCHADYVESDPNVYPLFLTGQKCMRRAVG